MEYILYTVWNIRGEKIIKKQGNIMEQYQNRVSKNMYFITEI